MDISEPTTDAVIVDQQTKTIRPALEAGDAYFGLGPGTNGTAAIMRRALVEPPGFTWVRASGGVATGILYVPGNGIRDNFMNPWGV